MTTGRIALIDDDSSVRRALSRLLRSEGLDARAFESAEDLLDSGFAERSSCLVVDIHLGAISGFELIERLHASGTRPGLVIITAESSPEGKRRAEELGAVAFLKKPFEASVLLEAVTEALQETAVNGSRSEPGVR